MAFRRNLDAAVTMAVADSPVQVRLQTLREGETAAGYSRQTKHVMGVEDVCFDHATVQRTASSEVCSDHRRRRHHLEGALAPFVDLNAVQQGECLTLRCLLG